MPSLPHIQLPPEVLPADGRFGSGPSKVRSEAVLELGVSGSSYLGTSHRRPAVKSVVAAIREGLADYYGLPRGFEVILGIGGATAFWDAAAFGLIEQRSQHLVFGVFSRKFADVVAAAPHLEAPDIIESEPGTHPASNPTPTSTYTPSPTTRPLPG